MNVSLTTELENFVSAKIESGRYTSPSELVSEAPHLLEQKDQARAAQLTAFNEELGRRLESLDQGRHVSASEARAGLRHRSEHRRKAQG